MGPDTERDTERDTGHDPGGSLERRARTYAALGEPVRLAVVDELVVSDRSPTELAHRFGLPSNLLAHHLDVLERAGLVERFVSSGDRRRRYVRLRRAAFDGLTVGHGRRPGRMLFVCSLNSARSQLAAALWRSRTGHAASSAGTRPTTRVHPGAVAAAERAGIDLRGAVPRSLGPVADGTQLVTVCDQAHEELAPPDTVWHWSIPDPVATGTDRAFDAAVRALDERISDLVRSDRSETGADPDE